MPARRALGERLFEQVAPPLSQERPPQGLAHFCCKEHQGYVRHDSTMLLVGCLKSAAALLGYCTHAPSQETPAVTRSKCSCLEGQLAALGTMSWSVGLSKSAEAHQIRQGPWHEVDGT